jgi:hypothetical protein
VHHLMATGRYPTVEAVTKLALVSGGSVAKTVGGRLNARPRPVQAAHHGRSWPAFALVEDFANQVLSFDSDAADMYAEVAGSRRTTGRPITLRTAALISLIHGRSGEK